MKLSPADRNWLAALRGAGGPGVEGVNHMRVR
jgi:hypothetical protein